MRYQFILLIILITACSETKEIRGQQYSQKATKNHFEHIAELKLPDKLDFCGEEIPIDIPEVRERAEREFFLLLQQPGQIMLYLKRSGRYFPMFEQVIRKHGMPDDLKYLSVAESALYMSRSTKGALGLWQFMPATGKAMGLHISSDVDERRHPEKSTFAAMKYLMQGYKSTKSWIATAAGYNMGHGGFSENMKFQDGDDYFDLFLNDETSRYIFRIVIIKELMKNRHKYGFILKDEDFYKQEKVKIIKEGNRISNLSDWAKQHNTTYKNVKLLNPWILGRDLSSPGRDSYWEIAVPAE